ncbi:capsule polysaccharide biosynthesis protein (plasmid) [Sinorhizobium fredii]|uniref:Capsule polysaccharide biosynthesis protein n=2 Tax=Rhizobium fredii TaxID=380 RepID=A0A2L0HGA9_RHIFR|nr:capsule polysaccharide biosynthesis protein [Sinorhizobium fredii]
MNVLIYCKPSLEGRAFHNSAHWVWLGHQLAKAFLNEGHAVSICLNSHQMERWYKQNESLLDRIENKFVVDFPSNITAGRFTLDHFLAASGSETDISAPLDVFKTAVGDAKFDCIISVCDRGILPRSAFPEAMHFSFVESPFTRAPYPRLWALDATGIDRSDVFHTGVASQFLEGITHPEIEAARRFAKDMSHKLKRRQLSELSLGRLRSKNVLVALQKEGVSALDTYTPYSSQLDFLLDVLETIPRDVGAVVTEHPQYPVIEKSAFNYLRENYPNLLVYPKWMAVEGISQNLLSIVDAAVVQTSTVGIQASLIFGKPAVCVAPESRVGPFVPCHDIGSLRNIEDIPVLRDDYRYRMLAFQLFRYTYTDQAAFEDGQLVRAVAQAFKKRDANSLYAEEFASREQFLKVGIAKVVNAAAKPRAFDKLIHLPGAPIALIETYQVHQEMTAAQLQKVKPPQPPVKRKPGRDTLKWRVLYALEAALPAAIVRPSEKVLKKLKVI